MIFWTRNMIFLTTSLNLFFQKAEKRHWKSHKEKKQNFKSNFFNVFLCTRQIQFWQVCQRIFGHYFSSKYSKTKSLWVFHFYLRMVFSTCTRLIWQPFLVFFRQKARKLSIKVRERGKVSRNWKKKHFFSKIFLPDTLEWVWTTRWVCFGIGHKNLTQNPMKKKKQIFKKTTFPQNVTIDIICTLLTSLPNFFCKLFFALKTRNLEFCGFFLFLTRRMII